MPVHDPQQVQGTHQVVVVVPQRLPNGLPDGLKPGEVDDGVHRVRCEDGVDGSLIEQVHRVESRGLSAEPGDPAKRFLAGVHTRLSMTTTSWPAS